MPGPRSRLAFVVALIALLATACATPPAPSASALPTTSPEPTEPIDGGPPIDFAGTTWQVVQLRGDPVPGRPPEIEFDRRGGPSSGFAGCEGFGFHAVLADGIVDVRDVEPAPFTCEQEPERTVEATFLETFRAATSYRVDGDAMLMTGAAGQIVFIRQAPPVDDPSRPTFERLRTGTWELLAAPGVARPELLDRAVFLDTRVIAGGQGCGYSGTLRFGAGGMVSVVDVGWDSIACEGDEEAREIDRLALQAALQAVARFDAVAGGIRFIGPGIEVVYGKQVLGSNGRSVRA